MKNASAAMLWTVFYLAFTGTWILLNKSFPDLARENGVMENYQAVCLLLGIIVFAAALKRSPGMETRVLFTGLILFYFTVLMLEIDTRATGHPWLIRLTNGKLRNFWLGLLWLGGGFLFFKHYQATWQFFRSWIFSKPGIFLLIGGFCWTASEVAEHGLHVRFFVEELLECVGVTLMLQSAWFTFRSVKTIEVGASRHGS